MSRMGKGYASRDKAPTIWLAASENYSGGMDSATDPRDIDKLQLQLVRNGYISLANRAVRRPGFDDLLAEDCTSAIKAKRRFKAADGTYNGMLVWEGTNLWAISDTGVKTNLKSDLTAASAVAHCEFAEVVYFSMPEHGLWSVTNTAGTLAAASVLATYDFSALAAREGSDRIFGIDADDPATMRWCDALTPGTWNAASIWRPGGKFTGILEVAGVLLAFQEERIMRIDGTDPTTWSTARASAEGLGLPAGAAHTLRELEGVAVYLSQTGLTVFDGSRPRVISNTVKSREQACRNFVPLTVGEWDGSFLEVWRDFLLVFYKADGTDTGCNRVLLYDFRRSIFSGVWELPEPVTCSSCDETGDGVTAALLLGTVSGNILRENDLFSDNGVAFEFGVKSKVYDCGREAIDKHVIEMRALYYAGGPTTLTMSLYRENDLTPSATVDHVIAAEGEGVIIKRVHHIRGRDFRIEFSQTDDVYLEVNGNEFDYFFAARR